MKVEEEGEEEIPQCMICYDELGKDAASLGCCGACFCFKCIYAWVNVSTHRNCPTCRYSLVVDDPQGKVCCQEVRVRLIEVERARRANYRALVRTCAEKQALERHPIIKMQKTLTSMWRYTVDHPETYIYPLLLLILILFASALGVYLGSKLVDWWTGTPIIEEAQSGCWDTNGFCDHGTDPGEYATIVARYQANTFMKLERDLYPPHLITVEIYNGYPSDVQFRVEIENALNMIQIETKTTKVMGLRKSPAISFPLASEFKGTAHPVHVSLHIKSSDKVCGPSKFRPIQSISSWVHR